MSQRPRDEPPAGGPVRRIGAARVAPSLDRILLGWRGPLERVAAYLVALGLDPAAVPRLARRALERALHRESGQGAVSDAMDETMRLLLETHPLADGADEVDAFTRWRLAAWQAGGNAPSATLEDRPLHATPPLTRGVMISERYRGRRLGEWRRPRRDHGTALDAESAPHRRRRRPRAPWTWRGRLRRTLLGLLVLAPSVAAGYAFLAMLPANVWLPVEIALATSFGALFGWISVGFWTALFGFVVILRGGDRFAITRSDDGDSAPLDPAVRTALVAPLKDESVERVFAGLRAMHASLERAGAVDAFDLFVLSDSADPDVWVDEEEAWANWRRSLAPEARIFYRRRHVRRKRKSGNVADFCRRFGRRYRYMVVLDADSVMSGECLVRLVRLMERNPDTGIIQTAPTVVRASSLFARIQQFASRLYGPMFAAGMHYWQLGDSPYWGHNAILRVEPFMRHCGLPRLSGRPPLGGDIMSHDFVEAALLGRAGWSVWLAFDLRGSYEETPASLLEEMQRDQRWCQGNLQHLRLLFTEGLASVHRALFLNGIFSYVSAMVWLLFLMAATTEAVLWKLWGPDYFPEGRSLFPTWPVWRPERAEALFAVVFAVLLLPKLLGFVLALRQREAAAFGGVGSLVVSVLLETLATAVFAPIRMVFYCRFVLLNLIGRAVTWRAGAEEAQETSWRLAWRRHAFDTLVACLWALGVGWLHPEAFWWLAPVAGALALSVPLSVLASRNALGAGARSLGWFVTPEESDPPREIRELEQALAQALTRRESRRTGFAGAVVDPLLNAVHTALLRGPRSLAPSVRETRRALLERALTSGPSALSASEKGILLSDKACMEELHARVWRLEEGKSAARWGLDTVAGPSAT